MVKEREFIETIRRRCQRQSDSMLLAGIGDDCAVFGYSPDTCWVTTTDLLVENVHFDCDWHDPYLLGRKTIAVNLSDIAAMGADPRFALLSVVLPPRVSDSWLDRWLEGVRFMLHDHDCTLIGGDTTTGSVLTFSVVIIGSGNSKNLLYRSGAMVGDDIYVTGPLGASAAGLAILQRKGQMDSLVQELLAAHFDPRPQVSLGRALAESGCVHAMQDISDGVATDVSHICRHSGVSARIYAQKLPQADQFDTICDRYALDREELMLFGGEDYELVFTADSSAKSILEQVAEDTGNSLYRIGTIVDGDGSVFLEKEGKTSEITYGGYEHTT